MLRCHQKIYIIKYNIKKKKKKKIYIYIYIYVKASYLFLQYFSIFFREAFLKLSCVIISCTLMVSLHLPVETRMVSNSLCADVLLGK